MKLKTIRHSLAHILAYAVKLLWPQTKLGIGPPTEFGFYYDFDFPFKFKKENLEKIEKKMRELIKKNLKFKKKIVLKKEAEKLFKNEPYKLNLLKEMKATQNNDIKGLDAALFSHIGFVISNLSRSIWFGLTNAIFESPGTPLTRRYYRRLSRLSAGFALLSDYALLTLGGNLKRRERLSGRFADILANMYLCSATLKHFENQGEPEADLPLLHYACQQTMHDAQQAMLALFYNLPFKPAAKILRIFMFPFGKPYSPPSDKLIHEVAKLALEPSPTRDRLTEGAYLSNNPTDPAGRIEHAFLLTIEAETIEKKLKQLYKQNKLTRLTHMERIDEALEKNLINKMDADLLQRAWLAMREAIRVDSFTKKEFER